ncbi:MAG: alpha/beta fold hydrolase [Crocinitomicaceae bacterium]|nr:alpha/beta fold hydrolase [Crocinitomicaceae bacterium]
MANQKIKFENSSGQILSARLELPADQKPHTYAIFAHCFTCNKNLSAVRNISRSLNQNGIAVLRFDFTGLGESEGEFSDTNFSSNVDDLVSAATFLSKQYLAPKLLIGHSLGGAAVLFAGGIINSINAIATIGAPSEPEHVKHLLSSGSAELSESGIAEIKIGGRPFTIKKQFIEDLKSNKLATVVKSLRKALLVLHSPQDTIVPIENAAQIYQNAHHPKSFVSLDGSDHLLSRYEDSNYVGNLIANWVLRYIDLPERKTLHTKDQVVVRLGKEDKYTTEIKAGKHQIIADEPLNLGGDDFGPAPYELLLSSLGSCTAITIKMYVSRKEWELEEVVVHLNHYKKDLLDENNKIIASKKVSVFERRIEIKGNLNEKQRTRILQIANKCPIHRTLEGAIEIETSIILD